MTEKKKVPLEVAEEQVAKVCRRLGLLHLCFAKTLVEEFGEERLKETVSRHKGLNAEEITKNIYNKLIQFRGRAPQHDDITIIVLKIN